jgi:signal peptidase
MEPELSVGDLIVVRPAAQSDIATGDIIMFTQGVDEIPTVHRVIGENKINTVLKGQDGAEDTTFTTKRFVTKGDANERPDSTEVTGDALKGELWFTVPGLGGTSGLPLQLILILIAGCLGVGWVCYEIYNRLGKNEKASGGGPA